MKKVLIIAVAGALAAAVGAKDFINEDFEGAFPPPGWKKVIYGDAHWDKSTREGPWGFYAAGTAKSWEYESSRATLSSAEFNVKAHTKYYYRFDYKANEYGNGSAGCEFYIKRVEPPGGTFLNVNLPWCLDWVERRGVFYATVDARVKACWRVWVECYWRGGEAGFRVDRVIISDEKRFPAVAPASLGRVKALFR